MPRPARPWFRFYVEAIHDRKLRKQPAAHRWLWVVVLASARASCRPGILLVSDSQPMDVDDLADAAAMSKRETRAGVEAFLAAGMLAVNDGAWVVVKWNDRQFESDDITERTRKHRSNEGGRNVPTSSVGTPPETEADTETELEKTHKVELHSTGPAEAVFAAWTESTGRTRCVLDPKRRRIIGTALKAYPLEDLVDAVQGWQHSPLHRGENDRHTIYNDIELLLRDAAHIEKFRDLHRHGDRVPLPVSASARTIAAWEAATS